MDTMRNRHPWQIGWLVMIVVARFESGPTLGDEGDEHEKLRGVWISESFYVDGKKVDNPELEYEFLDRDVVRVTYSSSGIVREGICQIEGQKMDFSWYGRYRWHGIYEIREEKLYLYLPTVTNSTDRPREFKIAPNVNRLELHKAS